MDDLIWLCNWLRDTLKEGKPERTEFRIGSIDNPGWMVALALHGNRFKMPNFESKLNERNETDWIHSICKNNTLKCNGGAPNLDEMIYYVRCLIENKSIDLANMQINPHISILSKWFWAQCDGDWEHCYGIRIQSIDLLAWSIHIEYQDTVLENAQDFLPVDIKRSEEDWLKCHTEKNTFKGNCGLKNLSEVLSVFSEWIEKKEKYLQWNIKTEEINQLNRYPLDFQMTRDYFSQQLQAITPMAIELHQSIDYKQGSFFTLLPSNIDETKLHIFNSNHPGFKAEQAVHHLMLNILCVSPKLSLIFDDLKRASFLHACQESTDQQEYDSYSSEDLTLLELKGCFFQTKPSFRSLCLLTLSDAIGSSKTPHLITDVRSACDHAQLIMLRSYGNQAYIFWMSNNLKSYTLEVLNHISK